MDKAYNVIYKDRIIVYSSEGYRINNSEFNTITKDFIGLVIKLMGPRFKEEFCTFYGGEEVFYFNLSDYFNSRFEDDGIRKSAIENFINKDVEEQLTGEKQ